MVAQIFGVRYLSMLGGFVFLSHQVGSLPRRLARRPAVRRDRQLRPRLVDRDRARRLRRARQPAGPRAARSLRPAAGMRAGAGTSPRWPGRPPPSRWPPCSRPTCGPTLAVDLANQHLDLLLSAATSSGMSRRTRSPPSPWIAALGAPDRARRPRARRRRRQRPAHALARRRAASPSPRSIAIAEAMAAAGGRRRDAWSPTSRAAPWPLAGRRFDAVVVTNYLWRPLLPTIVGRVAAGGVLLYETFAAGNETRRQAVAARLPAARRRTARRLRRVCTSWPTKTAS